MRNAAAVRLRSRDRSRLRSLRATVAMMIGSGVAGTLLLTASPAWAIADFPPLTEQEKIGQRIFRSGVGQQPITATVSAGQVVPSSGDFACQRCHGEDGAGQREGGVLVPSIRLPDLTAPLSGTRPSGRSHPAYAAATIGAALRVGVDPAGQSLHALMPRFRMSDSDMADLLAYLGRLGNEPVAGVESGSVRVAMLRPESGPLAEGGRSVETLLRAMFEDINDRGGVYGRKILLTTLAYDPFDRSLAAKRVAELIETGQVFCFVGSVGLQSNDLISKAIAAAGVPVIAPATPALVDATEDRGNVYTVLPGFDTQAKVMVDFVAERSAPRIARIAVVSTADDEGKRLAAAARRQVEKRQMALVAAIALPPQGLDERHWQELLASRADAILYLGGVDDSTRLAARLQDSDWQPMTVGSAERMAGGMIHWGRMPRLAQRFFAAALIDGQEPEPAAARRFGALVRPDQAAVRHLGLLWAAYSGVELLEHALRLTGRQLTKQRLTGSLDRIERFHAGVFPEITFSNYRREGTRGSRIIAAIAESGRWREARGWREPQ